MLSCSVISTDCHTIYIILYLDSRKYVCTSQAIHFQYLSAVYFIQNISIVWMLDSIASKDMPPLISRFLCFNLESEIIPSSDRFQVQSQQICHIIGNQMSLPKFSKRVFYDILRPDKRRWAVLSQAQPLDKYIWTSASQDALFAYSLICETIHTKSIYLHSYSCRIV